MPTPPTFVAEHETAWTGTAPTFSAFTPASGNLLLAFMAADNTDGTAADISITGGVTWSNVQDKPGSSAADCDTRVMSATGAGGSITPTLSNTITQGSPDHFGCNILEFSNHGGIGASAGTTNGVTGTHPTMNITTQADNSALAVIFADFNAVAAPSAFDSINGAAPTAQTNLQDSLRYTISVVWYADVGAAGTKTVGATYGTSADAQIIAVEIKAGAGGGGIVSSPDTFLLDATLLDPVDDDGGGDPALGFLYQPPVYQQLAPVVGACNIALVQSKLVSVGAVATTNLTLDSPVTAGNFLAAFSTSDESGTLSVTFSSTGSPTWASITPFREPTTAQCITIGWAANVPGGSTTVTVTWPQQGSNLALIVAEFSGIATASVLDVNTAGQSLASSGTPTDSPGMTTTVADLVLSLLIASGSSPTLGAGPGFTKILDDAATQMSTEWGTDATPGNIQPSFTRSPAGITGIMSAAFKCAAAAGAQTVSPVGIADDEEVGNPVLTPGAVTLSPLGIDDRDRVGQATALVQQLAPAGIDGTSTVGQAQLVPVLSPAGIDDQDRVGQSTLTATYTLSPVGIGSGEISGQSALAQAVAPRSVPTSDAVGQTALAPVLSPLGVASGAALGNPTLTQTLAPVGIASSEQLGQTSLAQAVAPLGVLSSEQLGNPVLTPGAVTLAPLGIGTAEAVGNPLIQAQGTPLNPVGIGSSEAVGQATLTQILSPAGIPSSERLGNPALTQTLAPLGIDASSPVGQSALAQAVAPAGIPSGEAVGQTQLTLRLAPLGILDAEAVGQSQLLLAQTLNPAGIGTGEQLGVSSLAQAVAPAGIGTGERVGLATLLPGTVTLAPLGIGSGQAVGFPFVGVEQALQARGIPSSERVGLTQLTVGAPISSGRICLDGREPGLQLGDLLTALNLGKTGPGEQLADTLRTGLGGREPDQGLSGIEPGGNCP